MSRFKRNAIKNSVELYVDNSIDYVDNESEVYNGVVHITLKEQVGTTRKVLYNIGSNHPISITFDGQIYKPIYDKPCKISIVNQPGHKFLTFDYKLTVGEEIFHERLRLRVDEFNYLSYTGQQEFNFSYYDDQPSYTQVGRIQLIFQFIQKQNNNIQTIKQNIITESKININTSKINNTNENNNNDNNNNNNNNSNNLSDNSIEKKVSFEPEEKLISGNEPYHQIESLAKKLDYIYRKQVTDDDFKYKADCFHMLSYPQCLKFAPLAESKEKFSSIQMFRKFYFKLRASRESYLKQSKHHYLAKAYEYALNYMNTHKDFFSQPSDPYTLNHRRKLQKHILNNIFPLDPGAIFAIKDTTYLDRSRSIDEFVQHILSMRKKIQREEENFTDEQERIMYQKEREKEYNKNKNNNNNDNIDNDNNDNDNDSTGSVSSRNLFSQLQSLKVNSDPNNNNNNNSESLEIKFILLLELLEFYMPKEFTNEIAKLLPVSTEKFINYNDGSIPYCVEHFKQHQAIMTQYLAHYNSIYNYLLYKYADEIHPMTKSTNPNYHFLINLVRTESLLNSNKFPLNQKENLIVLLKNWLKYFISIGVDTENMVNAKAQILTLLHTCCQENHTTELVNLLLDYGADIDKGNFSNNPPIVIALSSVRVDIARCLIYRGADLYKRNAKQRDAMYYALHSGKKSLQVLNGLVMEMRAKLLEILPAVVSPDAVNIITDYMFFASLKENEETT